MERLNKMKSIRKIFISYIVKFCAAVIITVFLLIAMVTAAMVSGIILPANDQENQLLEATKHISEYDSYREWIPQGCIYSVYDQNGKVLESNTEENESVIMWADVANHKTSRGTWFYKTIANGDETCVVKYKLITTYNNSFMNKYLPIPAVSFVVLFIILFIIEVVIFSNRFTKRITKELRVLKDTTDKIEMNNLEFQVENSKISEIEEVLISIDKMKRELQKSLVMQWHMEEVKERQIAALAHDIKTPLTILRGNAELMEETTLDEEQSLYNGNIKKSIYDMEDYLTALLGIMHSEKSGNLQFMKINLQTFLERILSDTMTLTKPENINFQLENAATIQYFTADETAIKRVILNLLSNSARYTPDSGQIRLSISNNEKMICFTVEDSGKGFSGEELRSAMEQFYQGDKSRNAENHYGLGLYIVENLVKNHGGSVHLSNSEVMGGAKVEIRLPIEHHQLG